MKIMRLFVLYIYLTLTVCDGYMKVDTRVVTKSAIESDNPFLVKLLQSVDEAPNNEYLVDVTLKLLKSLCVCMRETLREKQRSLSFNGETNTLYFEDHSRENDAKVLDLYKTIYNKTCFNVQKDLAKHNVTDNDHMNCGKTDNFSKTAGTTVNYLNNKDIKNEIDLKSTLFKSLILTRRYHNYTVKRQELYKKRQVPLSIRQNNDVIFLITFYPDNNKNKAIESNTPEELDKIIYSNSLIDITILTSKPGDERKKSQNKENSDVSECNLQSLYTFFVENEIKKLIKKFRVLNDRGHTRIYIETVDNNNTDYFNMCCNNKTRIKECEKNMLKDDVRTENKSVETLQHYKNTISKIKNLVRLYKKRVKGQEKINDKMFIINSIIGEHDYENTYNVTNAQKIHTINNNGSKQINEKNIMQTMDEVLSSTTEYLKTMTDMLQIKNYINSNINNMDFSTEKYTHNQSFEKERYDKSKIKMKSFDSTNKPTLEKIHDIIDVTIVPTSYYNTLLPTRSTIRNYAMPQSYTSNFKTTSNLSTAFPLFGNEIGDKNNIITPKIVNDSQQLKSTANILTSTYTNSNKFYEIEEPSKLSQSTQSLKLSVATTLASSKLNVKKKTLILDHYDSELNDNSKKSIKNTENNYSQFTDNMAKMIQITEKKESKTTIDIFGRSTQHVGFNKEITTVKSADNSENKSEESSIVEIVTEKDNLKKVIATFNAINNNKIKVTTNLGEENMRNTDSIKGVSLLKSKNNRDSILTETISSSTIKSIDKNKSSIVEKIREKENTNIKKIKSNLSTNSIEKPIQTEKINNQIATASYEKESKVTADIVEKISQKNILNNKNATRHYKDNSENKITTNILKNITQKENLNKRTSTEISTNYSKGNFEKASSNKEIATVLSTYNKEIKTTTTNAMIVNEISMSTNPIEKITETVNLNEEIAITNLMNKKESKVTTDIVEKNIHEVFSNKGIATVKSKDNSENKIPNKPLTKITHINNLNKETSTAKSTYNSDSNILEKITKKADLNEEVASTKSTYDNKIKMTSYMFEETTQKDRYKEALRSKNNSERNFKKDKMNNYEAIVYYATINNEINVSTNNVEITTEIVNLNKEMATTTSLNEKENKLPTDIVEKIKHEVPNKGTATAKSADNRKDKIKKIKKKNKSNQGVPTKIDKRTIPKVIDKTVKKPLSNKNGTQPWKANLKINKAVTKVSQYNTVVSKEIPKNLDTSTMYTTNYGTEKKRAIEYITNTAVTNAITRKIKIGNVEQNPKNNELNPQHKTEIVNTIINTKTATEIERKETEIYENLNLKNNATLKGSTVQPLMNTIYSDNQYVDINKNTIPIKEDMESTSLKNDVYISTQLQKSVEVTNPLVYTESDKIKHYEIEEREFSHPKLEDTTKPMNHPSERYSSKPIDDSYINSINLQNTLETENLPKLYSNKENAFNNIFKKMTSQTHKYKDFSLEKHSDQKNTLNIEHNTLNNYIILTKQPKSTELQTKTPKYKLLNYQHSRPSGITKNTITKNNVISTFENYLNKYHDSHAHSLSSEINSRGNDPEEIISGKAKHVFEKDWSDELLENKQNKSDLNLALTTQHSEINTKQLYLKSTKFYSGSSSHILNKSFSLYESTKPYPHSVTSTSNYLEIIPTINLMTPNNSTENKIETTKHWNVVINRNKIITDQIVADKDGNITNNNSHISINNKNLKNISKFDLVHVNDLTIMPTIDDIEINNYSSITKRASIEKAISTLTSSSTLQKIVRTAGIKNKIEISPANTTEILRKEVTKGLKLKSNKTKNANGMTKTKTQSRNYRTNQSKMNTVSEPQNINDGEKRVKQKSVKGKILVKVKYHSNENNSSIDPELLMMLPNNSLNKQREWNVSTPTSTYKSVSGIFTRKPLKQNKLGIVDQNKIKVTHEVSRNKYHDKTISVNLSVFKTLEHISQKKKPFFYNERDEMRNMPSTETSIKTKKRSTPFKYFTMNTDELLNTKKYVQYSMENSTVKSELNAPVTLTDYNDILADTITRSNFKLKGNTHQNTINTDPKNIIDTEKSNNILKKKKLNKIKTKIVTPRKSKVGPNVYENKTTKRPDVKKIITTIKSTSKIPIPELSHNIDTDISKTTYSTLTENLLTKPVFMTNNYLEIAPTLINTPAYDINVNKPIQTMSEKYSSSLVTTKNIYKALQSNFPTSFNNTDIITLSSTLKLVSESPKSHLDLPELSQHKSTEMYVAVTNKQKKLENNGLDILKYGNKQTTVSSDLSDDNLIKNKVTKEISQIERNPSFKNTIDNNLFTTEILNSYTADNNNNTTKHLIKPPDTSIVLKITGNSQNELDENIMQNKATREISHLKRIPAFKNTSSNYLTTTEMLNSDAVEYSDTTKHFLKQQATGVLRNELNQNITKSKAPREISQIKQNPLFENTTDYNLFTTLYSNVADYFNDTPKQFIAPPATTIVYKNTSDLKNELDEISTKNNVTREISQLKRDPILENTSDYNLFTTETLNTNVADYFDVTQKQFVTTQATFILKNNTGGSQNELDENMIKNNGTREISILEQKPSFNNTTTTEYKMIPTEILNSNIADNNTDTTKQIIKPPARTIVHKNGSQNELDKNIIKNNVTREINQIKRNASFGNITDFNWFTTEKLNSYVANYFIDASKQFVKSPSTTVVHKNTGNLQNILDKNVIKTNATREINQLERNLSLKNTTDHYMITTEILNSDAADYFNNTTKQVTKLQDTSIVDNKIGDSKNDLDGNIIKDKVTREISQMKRNPLFENTTDYNLFTTESLNSNVEDLFKDTPKQFIKPPATTIVEKNTGGSQNIFDKNIIKTNTTRGINQLERNLSFKNTTDYYMITTEILNSDAADYFNEISQMKRNPLFDNTTDYNLFTTESLNSNVEDHFKDTPNQFIKPPATTVTHKNTGDSQNIFDKNIIKTNATRGINQLERNLSLKNTTDHYMITTEILNSDAADYFNDTIKHFKKLQDTSIVDNKIGDLKNELDEKIIKDKVTREISQMKRYPLFENTSDYNLFTTESLNSNVEDYFKYTLKQFIKPPAITIVDKKTGDSQKENMKSDDKNSNEHVSRFDPVEDVKLLKITHYPDVVGSLFDHVNSTDTQKMGPTLLNPKNISHYDILSTVKLFLSNKTSFDMNVNEISKTTVFGYDTNDKPNGSSVDVTIKSHNTSQMEKNTINSAATNKDALNFPSKQEFIPIPKKDNVDKIITTTNKMWVSDMESHHINMSPVGESLHIYLTEVPLTLKNSKEHNDLRININNEPYTNMNKGNKKVINIVDISKIPHLKVSEITYSGNLTSIKASTPRKFEVNNKHGIINKTQGKSEEFMSEITPSQSTKIELSISGLSKSESSNTTKNPEEYEKNSKWPKNNHKNMNIKSMATTTLKNSASTFNEISMETTEYTNSNTTESFLPERKLEKHTKDIKLKGHTYTVDEEYASGNIYLKHEITTNTNGTIKDQQAFEYSTIFVKNQTQENIKVTKGPMNDIKGENNSVITKYHKMANISTNPNILLSTYFTTSRTSDHILLSSQTNLKDSTLSPENKNKLEPDYNKTRTHDQNKTLYTNINKLKTNIIKNKIYTNIFKSPLTISRIMINQNIQNYSYFDITKSTNSYPGLPPEKKHQDEERTSQLESDVLKTTTPYLQNKNIINLISGVHKGKSNRLPLNHISSNPEKSKLRTKTVSNKLVTTNEISNIYEKHNLHSVSQIGYQIPLFAKKVSNPATIENYNSTIPVTNQYLQSQVKYATETTQTIFNTAEVIDRIPTIPLAVKYEDDFVTDKMTSSRQIFYPAFERYTNKILNVTPKMNKLTEVLATTNKIIETAYLAIDTKSSTIVTTPKYPETTYTDQTVLPIDKSIKFPYKVEEDSHPPFTVQMLRNTVGTESKTMETSPYIPLTINTKPVSTVSNYLTINNKASTISLSSENQQSLTKAKTASIIYKTSNESMQTKKMFNDSTAIKTQVIITDLPSSIDFYTLNTKGNLSTVYSKSKYVNLSSTKKYDDKASTISLGSENQQSQTIINKTSKDSLKTKENFDDSVAINKRDKITDFPSPIAFYTAFTQENHYVTNSTSRYVNLLSPAKNDMASTIFLGPEYQKTKTNAKISSNIYKTFNDTLRIKEHFDDSLAIDTQVKDTFIPSPMSLFTSNTKGTHSVTTSKQVNLSSTENNSSPFKIASDILPTTEGISDIEDKIVSLASNIEDIPNISTTSNYLHLKAINKRINKPNSNITKKKVKVPTVAVPYLRNTLSSTNRININNAPNSLKYDFYYSTTQSHSYTNSTLKQNFYPINKKGRLQNNSKIYYTDSKNIEETTNSNFNDHEPVEMKHKDSNINYNSSFKSSLITHTANSFSNIIETSTQPLNTSEIKQLNQMFKHYMHYKNKTHNNVNGKKANSHTDTTDKYIKKYKNIQPFIHSWKSTIAVESETIKTIKYNTFKPISDEDIAVSVETNQKTDKQWLLNQLNTWSQIPLVKNTTVCELISNLSHQIFKAIPVLVNLLNVTNCTLAKELQSVTNTETQIIKPKVITPPPSKRIPNRQILRTTPSQKKLLNPPTKTKLYPVKSKPIVMRRVNWNNKKTKESALGKKTAPKTHLPVKQHEASYIRTPKPINSQTFKPNRKLVKNYREFLPPKPVLSPPFVPKLPLLQNAPRQRNILLRPKFQGTDPKDFKVSRLSKPLIKDLGVDFYREDFRNHHKPSLSWRDKIKFIQGILHKNTRKVSDDDGSPVLDIPRLPGLGVEKPTYLRDRINSIRSYVYSADFAKTTTRAISKTYFLSPEFPDVTNEEQVIGPLPAMANLRRSHQSFQDLPVTTDAYSPKRTRRTPRTIFFLSPTVTDWWLDDMYLKVRAPLPINSNPGMVFPRRHFAKMEEVADLGALFIDDLLDYKEMLDRGELPIERATSREKGQPLCMEQFYRLLGVARSPRVGEDVLELPSSDHDGEREELVVVACRNYFYPIPVKAADRGRLTAGEIQAQLLHAMVDAAGAPPAPRVGLLTSMNRDSWAKTREQLIKDENNRTNMELISRALCLVCVDEAGGDRANTDPDSNAMLRALHGAGTVHHSANRWFDKTVQLIISSDGTVGMCYEHSAAEGVAVVRLMERAMARAEVSDRPAPPPVLLPAPQAMKWNITPDVLRTIDLAARDFDRAIANLDFKVYTYRGYGREFMKSCRTSPDVYIQLALQFAYFKMYGHLTSTYESASLRRFRSGRVDNIRSAHAQAKAWADAMCSAEPTHTDADDGQKKVSFNLFGDQKKLELFDEAALKQTQIMEDNILGRGIDNHLLGLREAARESLGYLPQLFTDPVYQMMIEYKLSTSQVTTTVEGTAMGYGPVVPDGYGCSYNPKKESIIFSISSFHSSNITNTEAFRQFLEEALDSMKLMLQNRKVD